MTPVQARVVIDGRAGDAIEVDRADTVFELGSVTKTVTAALVHVAARDGSLSLDDGVGRWLDAGSNSDVTVRQLVTHTSGLPKVAMRAAVAHPADPYRDVDSACAQRELREATPDATHRYSNLGYQLLGLVLERATGLAYADLVADWLPRRFGVHGVDVAVAGTAAQGHAGGVPVVPWQQPLPAAGGLCCTADGLASWLAVHVRPGSVPEPGVRAALTALLEPTAYGVWTFEADGTAVHTGQSAGFAAAVLVDPAARRAAGAICADSTGVDVQVDAARALLHGSAAAQRPVDPQWRDHAQRVVDALRADRTADVRAMMTPQLQQRISTDALAATWLLQATATGAVGQVDVRCTPRGRYTAAEATLHGATRSSRVAMIFTPDVRIARFALLGNDQPTPW